MSLHRYYTPQIGALTRYHTPVVKQRGGGLTKDLLKVAGPDAKYHLRCTAG